VAGTSVPPFLSRDGQDIVHENPEQKYLNANKIIEIQKLREGGLVEQLTRNNLQVRKRTPATNAAATAATAEY
jgi:hypothetical protein